MSSPSYTSSSRHGDGSIERLSHDHDDGSGSVMQRAGERASYWRESARDLVRRGSDSVLDKAHAVREGVLHAGDRTRGYVRDEPMKSVLMAAAIGAGVAAALMLVWSSSRQRDDWY